MRNASDLCVECGGRIPPGAPVAIVHSWDATRIEGWSPKTHIQIWPWRHKRLDHWLCLDCARSKYRTENSFADTGRCENCEREIRHWDLSQRMPTACCAECRRLASNKRSRERRRITNETIACEKCGETFEPTRADARFCSSRCRQSAYRERKAVTDDGCRDNCPGHVNRNATPPVRRHRGRAR
jgi:hypothetical protein